MFDLSAALDTVDHAIGNSKALFASLDFGLS